MPQNPFDVAEPITAGSSSNPFDNAIPHEQPWRDAGTPAPAGPVPQYTPPPPTEAQRLHTIHQNQDWIGKVTPPVLAGMGQGIINMGGAVAQGTAHAIDNWSAGFSPSGQSTHLAAMVDPLVQQERDYYDHNFEGSKVGEFVGGMLPFLGLGAGEAAAQKLSGAQRLMNVLKGGAAGTALAPALTPETDLNPQDPNDYTNRKWREAGMGAAFGTAVSAAPEVFDAASNLKTSLTNAVRGKVTGYKGQLPPEILSGETPANIIDPLREPGIKDNTYTPQEAGAKVINDLKIKATGNTPEAIQVRQTLQRLNVATAKQFDIPLTLGEVTQDPTVLANEQALETARGSNIPTFRQQQALRVNQSINDLQNPDYNPSSFNFNPEDESPLQQKLRQEAGTVPGRFEYGPDGEQIPLIDKNSPAGKLYAAISSAPDNDSLVQASLKAKEWEANRTSKIYHEAAQKGIDDGIAANPQLPGEVDLTGINKQIHDAITENSHSLYPDAELHTELAKINPRATAPYAEVKETVSQLQEAAERLKENGNRSAAAELNALAKNYDIAKDSFASQFLAPEYNAKGDYVGVGHPDAVKNVAQVASDYHRDNVIPFRDPDVGINKIIKGEYADTVNKKLYTIDNAQQFNTIFKSLDPKGQEALKAEMLNRATEFATGSGTKPLDPQAWARYVTKHQEQFETAFNTSNAPASDPILLSNLINQMPRVGVGASSTPANVLSSGHTAKMVAAGLGYPVGGPLGSLAVVGAESVGEAGLNRLAGNMFTKPNLGALTSEALSTPSLGSNPHSSAPTVSLGDLTGYKSLYQPSAQATFGQAAPTNVAPPKPALGLGDQPGFTMTRQKGQDLGAGEFDPLRQKLTNVLESFKTMFKGGDQAPEVKELNDIVNLGLPVRKGNVGKTDAELVAETLNSKYNKIGMPSSDVSVEPLEVGEPIGSKGMTTEQEAKLTDQAISEYIKRNRTAAEILIDQNADKLNKNPFSAEDYSKIQPGETYTVNGMVYRKPTLKVPVDSKLKAPDITKPITSVPPKTSSLASTPQMSQEEIDSLLKFKPPGRK